MKIPVPLILWLAVGVIAISLYLRPGPAEVGFALEGSGRLDDALAYYKTALEANPADEPTWARLANAYLRRGESEAAIEAYRRLTMLDATDVGYRRLLAQLYEWSLQINQSMAQRAVVAELDPKDVGVRAELADYYVLDRKDYAEAIRLMEEIVAARPHDVDVMLQLADLYTQTKQLSKAIATYQRAQTEEEGDPTIARGLTRVMSWNASAEAAIAARRAELADRPNDPAALTRLRDVLLSAGRAPEADDIERQLRAAAPQP